MSFSTGFKINVNKLNASEALLPLLEITHPFITTPVRLVNDNQDLLSNGDTFLAMSFQLKRQNDVQGELPQVSLEIPNIGRTLVRWIDSSGGGRDAQIKVMLARRSTPDLIEETLTLGVQRVSINTEVVAFALIVQNDLVRRSMRYVYDKDRAPGLF